MLAGLGLVGLLGVLLFGEMGMRIIFGPQFAYGASYLVAGTAFGVLPVSYTHLTLPTNREV